MANLARYQWVLLFLTGLTFLVVIVGAYTRLSDAGLGCPDWPGCYGSLLVPQSIDTQNQFAHIPLEKDKAWIEMFHRYIAGILGLSIFTLTFFAFVPTTTSSPRRRGSIFQRVSIRLWNMDPRLRGDDGSVGNPLYPLRGLLGFTSVLIVFQAALGMWTVTKLLHPTIVMLHLLGGMATLSMVWLAYLRLQNPPADAAAPFEKGAKVAAFGGLLIVILQIALGGWVSTNYAAFACPDFPTCQAYWLPPIDWQAFNIFIPFDRNFAGGFLENPARLSIHFIHRMGALITFIYLIGLGVYCLRNTPFTKLVIILWFILGVQILLGIINVIALLPLWAAVLHNGVAALLLLTIITLNYRLQSTH